jgi:hypothetical protein
MTEEIGGDDEIALADELGGHRVAERMRRHQRLLGGRESRSGRNMGHNPVDGAAGEAAAFAQQERAVGLRLTTRLNALCEILLNELSNVLGQRNAALLLAFAEHPHPGGAQAHLQLLDLKPSDFAGPHAGMGQQLDDQGIAQVAGVMGGIEELPKNIAVEGFDRPGLFADGAGALGRIDDRLAGDDEPCAKRRQGRNSFIVGGRLAFMPLDLRFELAEVLIHAVGCDRVSRKFNRQRCCQPLRKHHHLSTIRRDRRWN